MDSFFSLFDPSDGNETKQKKKHKPEPEIRKDGPKGRRRGRRSQGKNETLPEESSFLCEPDLSNEILVKDCNYIENYMEVKSVEDKEKASEKDIDKKPKRRNSGRKNRRKKKPSPPKEFCWSQEEPETLNNQSVIQKNSDERIGKNVNILKPDKKCNKFDKDTEAEIAKAKRKVSAEFDERVYNVIDNLEKVRIKDDMYMAGEFSSDDLESDFFYSSDDLDEFCDDTTTDAEDSGDECYGSLPPEPRFGNVEYKLQLVAPCERRFQHLVTQLKWRLRSGGGSAVYVVGVRDCGALRGLRAAALRASLRSLRDMARAIGAEIVAARARRLAPHRAVAEVYIRKLAASQSVELRVAVLGANEAGKSTLVGVLTQGELDNGRGSARLNMFRHLHEVKSGRTSSLSHEILGFDAQGNVVNYGCSELMTAERIGERSAKLVAFLDLAGHTKYQRTTLHGLTGYSPHYAMLVISATAGITRITEEHLGLVVALDLPVFVVVTKCELAPAALPALLDRLTRLLPTDKKPLLITDENLARSCVAPQKSILDTIDDENDNKKDDECSRCVPVFPVSCVRGAGLNALHAYLLALQPPDAHAQPAHLHETCEFQIDEIFHVGEAGPVVGGLLARGQLREGDDLIIGPLDNGEFVEISVKTIYRNRVPCGAVRAGQSASLGLSHYPPSLRQGMVLLAVPGGYQEGKRPTFGACPPGRCKLRQTNVDGTQVDKNRKAARRKKISQSSDGEGKSVNVNMYEKSVQDASSDEEKCVHMPETCICPEIMLEDPNDPRGCIFFQASVQVLRHSTAIYPGFQCSVHVGNVRQTAIIEAIMSVSGELRAGQAAAVVFRFARCPEYLVCGRRLLFTAGLGTRGIGRITQTFPYIP
ncbi:GTP-binding protein 2-like [Aricia agestis]|uniref:GTP-binding protein 2-like n=1 Tax=Aricia agestis TaxID=91739 RepID=UPI001C20B1B9|nr:GTP-binding protein 2-like [Aricia agestis]XP_041984279.1 GTP-binding protein 2-like [Aricia agestis]